MSRRHLTVGLYDDTGKVVQSNYLIHEGPFRSNGAIDSDDRKDESNSEHEIA
jgi:hypothetical protein